MDTARANKQLLRIILILVIACAKKAGKGLLAQANAAQAIVVVTKMANAWKMALANVVLDTLGKIA